MLDRIIFIGFAAIFGIVPLFWTPLNYELFEYNKMMLTYALTIIIVCAWLLKMVNRKALIFNRTLLDIPLLLFLGANILSTIFSIDPHTSIWGYYSRSNGGLLSLFSYLLLYWAFASNINKAQVLKLLKIGLISGFVISLYGIMEHFGISPSCILLNGQFNASCWVQQVQDRVFATLGQPNWLAAYLAMLIFPAIYFFLSATTQRQRIIYFLSLITMYLAFTFTYTRGATLGLIAGIIVFFVLSFVHRQESTKQKAQQSGIKYGMRVLTTFIAINILFGSALTGGFRLIKQDAAPARPSVISSTSGTQLENGGTESGQIRLIVWRGALDIFKHYPLFGSGVETFAYSYYQFRPVAHNQTSEWDFLYNKAHNEFLNYLATTGIIGFASYLLIIASFIIWSFKYLTNKRDIFIASLLASYLSYLVQEFFLFSVVIVAIFFYLFPAIAFVITGEAKPTSRIIPQLSLSFLYRRPVYARTTKIILLLVTGYLLLMLFRLWYGDVLFANGQNHNELGNPGKAYNSLSQAVNLNKNEPLYRSELGYAAGSAALALAQDDASLSAELKDEATSETDRALSISPKNVSLWRTAIRTYFELSGLDPSFNQKTLEAVDQSIKLAPTDPKLYYNKALILESLERYDEASQSLQKAVQLKPDYSDALEKIKSADTPTH